MVAIHQFSAGFKGGDAISNEARVLRDLFRKWGHPSEVFSEPGRVERKYRKEVGDVAAAASGLGPEDIVVLHLSTGSPVNQVFAELPCRKVIIYHNVTPPEFFTGIQERVYHTQSDGHEQVSALAGAADVNLAVSAYNAGQLTDMGYRDVKVLPLVLDLGLLRHGVNEGLYRELNDGLTNIIFVGRCARNKKLEDLLSAFHFFQRYVQPASRLIQVGSYGAADAYYSTLLVLARRLRLENVRFTGSIPQADLNACFKASHLFLCMSEHEGFCIPLLESMVHDVPVMAYAAAAVPETLDGAGVLFHEKRFDQLAEMMGELTRNPALRESVLDGQRKRLARYENLDLEGMLRSYLAPLLRPS